MAMIVGCFGPKWLENKNGFTILSLEVVYNKPTLDIMVLETINATTAITIQLYSIIL